MLLIFCFTQLPYFTGANTAEAIHKAVITEHNSINTPSADHVDINMLNLINRKSTHLPVFGILALLLFYSLKGRRFAYIISGRMKAFIFDVKEKPTKNAGKK